MAYEGARVGAGLTPLGAGLPTRVRRDALDGVRLEVFTTPAVVAADSVLQL